MSIGIFNSEDQSLVKLASNSITADETIETLNDIKVSVATDKASVAADKASVTADKADIVSMKSEIANTKTTIDETAQTVSENANSVQQEKIAIDETKTDIDKKYTEISNTASKLNTEYNNLTSNYYTKEATNSLISSTTKLKYSVVNELPTSDISTDIIYLKSTNTTSTDGIYEMYTYQDSNWVKIGTSNPDLADYYTKELANSTFATKTEINNTNTEISELKEDLDDLIMSLEKNLIPIATIEKGYVGADKEFYKTTSWEALKIPASKISLISHSSLFTNNTYFYAISFYSTETITASSFISGVQFGELDNVNFYNVNVPDDAEIIVVCNRIDSGECVVNGIDSSVINVIDENIQSVKENTLSNLTLIDCDYTKKGYLNLDGSFVSNASWKCYLFNIENLQADSLNASVYSNNLNFNSIAFYNDLIISTDTFIEGLSPKNVAGTRIDFTNVKVPVDAKLVVIATRTATAKDETAIIRVVQGGLLFKNIYSDKVNHDYYKGQLKNVYENLGIANDITFVGGELWGGSILNNDTGETQINRYKLTDMGYVLLGSIHTDFGHLNSMDYNAQNDCLIFGNGGNGFETDNNWFAIVKNPLALGTSATLAENATIFNVDVGYKVQAVWGDNNLGLNNIVYLLSNNGQTITKVFLNLDENGDFDGTYKVLETKELDKTYFVGGCKFWGDNLYIGYADNTYKIAEISMTDYTAKVVHKHFYRSDGTELVGTTQGVHIDSRYLWVFVNSTNPINNYLLQYYR